jgi:hypothetical protein
MLLSSDNILWKQKVAEIASFSSLSVEEVIQLCDQYRTTDFKAVHRNQDSKDFWKKLYVRFKLKGGNLWTPSPRNDDMLPQIVGSEVKLVQ